MRTGQAPPRIFADFIDVDDEGRVRLICKGTFADLQRQRIDLKEGMQLLLYNDDVELFGRASYSRKEKIWVAAVDWPRAHPWFRGD